MITGLVAIFGLVLLSPFALVELVHYRHNWSQLSDIGQTYGAVSALLSSLALGGVIVSLLFQARDNQNAREQTTRTLQLELIRLELNDPSLMTAGGAPWDLDIPPESTAIRAFLYVRMWVAFLGGNYTIGELSETDVRHIAAHELFRSEAGRNYWAAIGHLQFKNSRGRRKRFFGILEEEYRKVIDSGVPVATPVKVTDTSRRSQTPSEVRWRAVRRLCGLTLAATVGVVAGKVWTDKKCDHSPPSA
jgi:hypothetical protein